MSEEKYESENPERMLEMHERYVSSIKDAMRKVLKNDALPPSRVAVLLGMKRLHLPAPPMLEAALSYRGQLPFVAFHYSPRLAVPVHSDGGDDAAIPNPSDWFNFITHPAVCPELDGYPTLYARLSRTQNVLTHEQFEELDDSERGAYCSRFHALVLDRERRTLYISNWQSLKMFQPYSEPEDGRRHFTVVNGRMVSRGDENYQRPAASETISALIGWLNDQLNHPESKLRLAHWHIHNGRPQEGFQVLRSILEEHPDWKQRRDFQHTLSFLFQQIHDYNSAINAFRKFAVDFPLDSYDHIAFAKLMIEAKRYDEALEQLGFAAEKDSEIKNSEWYALTARAYAGLGDLDRAVQACNTGISRSRSNHGVLDTGSVHVQLAEIAALRCDFGTAALECRAAIQEVYENEAELEDSIVVYRPGWWLSADACLANAARRYEEAAESAFAGHLGQGYLYLGMSRYAEAEEQFRKASSINSSSEAAWFWGVSALASKRKDDAIRIFEEMARLFPRDEHGLAGLGLVHAAQGSNDVALEYCERALKMNPEGGELNAVLAYLYWSQANYEKAAAAGQKASRAGFPIHYSLLRPPEDDSKDHRFLMLDEENDLHKFAVT